MRKILLISLALAVAIGLATTVILNAHTPGEKFLFLYLTYHRGVWYNQTVS